MKIGKDFDTKDDLVNEEVHNGPLTLKNRNFRCNSISWQSIDVLQVSEVSSYDHWKGIFDTKDDLVKEKVHNGPLTLKIGILGVIQFLDNL